MNIPFSGRTQRKITKNGKISFANFATLLLCCNPNFSVSIFNHLRIFKI
jgi:hypothetical protein